VVKFVQETIVSEREMMPVSLTSAVLRIISAMWYAMPHPMNSRPGIDSAKFAELHQSLSTYSNLRLVQYLGELDLGGQGCEQYLRSLGAVLSKGLVARGDTAICLDFYHVHRWPNHIVAHAHGNRMPATLHVLRYC
jgi:hypothetical protein